MSESGNSHQSTRQMRLKIRLIVFLLMLMVMIVFTWINLKSPGENEFRIDNPQTTRGLNASLDLFHERLVSTHQG